MAVKETLPCRLLDTVAVKGRSKGVKIYTAQRRLDAREKESWGLHNMGMAEYYDRSFSRAARYFTDVLKIFPKDMVAQMLLDRCLAYGKNPPPQGWDGVEVMTHK